MRADQQQTIALASQHGFESIEAFPQFIATLSAGQLADLKAELKAKALTFGMAGLPVDFRGTDERLAEGLKELPRLAGALQQAGIERVTTWLSPAHRSLAYAENFELHRRRLRAIAQVLKDHGLRFGLEYVGTPNSRRGRIDFIHNMAQTKELIAAIGTGNIGFVLDSWHWWTAGDSEADLRTLKAKDVVSVDLNDAPAGRTLEQQLDNQRELPGATGVIPVAKFLTALKDMGYDGPVRAEPFNKVLNDLPNDEACARTIQALRKTMKLVA